MHFVCTYRRSTPVQSSLRPKGHQWWLRDVFHASEDGKQTLCGRYATEWLKLDARPVAEALEDRSLCSRCAKKLLLKSI
jgi:hypothetical protein